MAKDKRAETVTWDDDVWADVDEAPAAVSPREPVEPTATSTPPKPDGAPQASADVLAAKFPSTDPKPPNPEPTHQPAVSLVKTAATVSSGASKRPEIIPAAVSTLPKVQPPPPDARTPTESTKPKIEQPPPLPQAATLPAKPAAAPLPVAKAPVQPVPAPKPKATAETPAASAPPAKLPSLKKPLAAIFRQAAIEEAPVTEESTPAAPKTTFVKPPKLGPAFARQEEPPKEA